MPVGDTIEQTPSRTLLIALGDFNAPLSADGLLVRNPAPGQENSNSALLRAFLIGHDLWTVNGNLRQHPRKLATFYGPTSALLALTGF